MIVIWIESGGSKGKERQKCGRGWALGHVLRMFLTAHERGTSKRTYTDKRGHIRAKDIRLRQEVKFN